MSRRGSIWVFGALCVAFAANAAAQAAAGKKPAPAKLTPGPPAKALFTVQLRLKRVLEQLHVLGGEALAPNDFELLNQHPTVDPSRPLLMGASVQTDNYWIAFSPNGAPPTDAPDATLSAAGLTPVHDASCVLARGSAAVEICGATQTLAASSADILGRYARGEPRADIDIELNFRELAQKKSVADLRSSVPKAVEQLLALSPGLAQEPAAVHALSDLAFDWVYGVNEAYFDSGPLHVTVNLEPAGGARMEASIRPPTDTRLGRVATASHLLTPPAAFWQFPSFARTAVYTNTDSWRPFFTPSARAGAFFTRLALANGSEAQKLGFVAAALQGCFGDEHAITFVIGDDEHTPGHKKPQAKPSPDKKKAASARPTNQRYYLLLGLEDPSGSCSRPLQALLASLPGAKPAPTSSGSLSLGPAKPPANFPRTLATLSLDSSNEWHTVFTLAASAGTTWIGWADGFDSLDAPLRAALHPSPRDVEHAKRLPELADLSSTPVLLGGFVENMDPLAESEPKSRPDLPLLPLSILAQGGTLVSSSRVEPKLVSTLLAQLLANAEDTDPPKAGTAAQQAAHRKVLATACTLGSDAACNHLGMIYLDGRGIPADGSAASPYFRGACEHGFALSCGNLAQVEAGHNPTEARRLFDKACSLGSPYGCTGYGGFLLESKANEDHALALDKNRIGCDARRAIACANLGYQYTEGKGTSADLEKGLEYYSRSCQLGSGLACTASGNLLFDGKGHAKDEPLAFKFYQRACELEYATGCYQLGLCYLYGHGTNVDPEKARQSLTSACDGGQAEACRDLAKLMEGGK